MRIDAHVHAQNRRGQIDALRRAMEELKMDKAVIFGSGGIFPDSSDDDILSVAEKHPNLFIPFAFFRLGKDKPAKVKESVARGFRGFKTLNPVAGYDSKDYYEVYTAMQEAGTPCLFHTGIIMRHDETDAAQDVNSDKMRPVRLDPIVRAFPRLNVIMAHLGNPWYDEACMMLRWHPNLYSDLSGSTLVKKSPPWFREMLWWSPTSRYREPLKRWPFEKILFGSDVLPEGIPEVHKDYVRLLDTLDLPQDQRDKVFGGTMAGLLGMKG